MDRHSYKKTVKQVLHQLRIKQRLGYIYHPQSQGMVEKLNGTLNAKLNKICESTKLNWIDSLPLALMSYRMQTNRHTHLTPHEMLTHACGKHFRPMPVPYCRAIYVSTHTTIIIMCWPAFIEICMRSADIRVRHKNMLVMFFSFRQSI